MLIMPKIIAGGMRLNMQEMTSLKEIDAKHNIANKIQGRRRAVAITQGQHAFAKLGLNIPAKALENLVNQE